MVVYKTTDIKN